MSLPPNVTAEVDRHGKLRFRFRKVGFPSYSFKGHPGTAANPSAEYKAVIAGRKPEEERAAPGTIADLIGRYYGSASFNAGGAVTRQKNRAILDEFKRAHGHRRIATIQFNHVEAILLAKSRKAVKKTQNGKDRVVGGPQAAERLKKNLRRVFEYAMKLRLIEVNPVELAGSPPIPKTGGFHSWTDEEIAQFRSRHPVGTKARLALEIVLWTLQRRDDARTFGPAHVRGDRVNYTQGKGGKNLWLPAVPQLLDAIAAMPAIGMTTFLVTEHGRTFTNQGFGNWFKKRCTEAGLPHCTLHGLRKATARRLAETKATQQELKASGGWSNDREVATYTAAADQERLAVESLTRLAALDLPNRGKKVRQSEPGKA